ncbi:hypothetical protein HPB47_014015 [Ixodes persulcatus]|uniref:Uncharacterized protein n=1 Tax=Ixodes persulcatus TaxID=34615 RepID=A0AC60QX08_IXOPE|nr:hypothetical protein HPB47_014015 [Ixodes persulcatus]
MTLRYLSSGDLIQDIAISFRVGISVGGWRCESPARLCGPGSSRSIWWRCAENAFGILVTRWRILQKRLGESPQNAEFIVKALCVLHNFLMQQHAGDDAYCAAGYADSVNSTGERQGGEWRRLLVQPPMQVARTLARNFADMARYVRDLYRLYFNSAAGKVSWQDAVLKC